MKTTKLFLALIIISSISFSEIIAGNKDRAGQAGASELLIMPFPRSNGLANSNAAYVRGLEAMYLNVAGTAFTPKTEIVYAFTDYLKGADITINSFGFTQKVGETGVLGLGVMSMGFGDVEITTVNKPEGGIGKYKPSLLNIGMSYAKAFSNSIYGGVAIKVISEAISDVSAQGVAIDAGIQYVTGANDEIKFGIALRNVGPSMKFSGDGLSMSGTVEGSIFQQTIEQRSAAFELPALLNIGAAYDFFLNEEKNQILTVSGTFVSNSFEKDNFTFGLQYDFKKLVYLRVGYHYEQGITEAMPTRTTCLTGPAAGFSIHIPTNKESGSFISIDYSFRATNPYQGIHTLGARINL